MSPLTFLFVLFSVFIVVESSFFSKDDAQFVRDLVYSHKGADGSFGDLSATDAAVSTLKLLGEDLDDSLCAQVREQLEQDETVSAIYHGVKLLEALQCGSFEVTEDQSSALSDALDSEDVSELFFALAAISKLPSEKELVDFATANAVIALLGELSEADGTVRNSEEDEEGDHFTAGLAYHALTSLNKIVNVESLDDIDTVILGAQDLLEAEISSFGDASQERNVETVALVWSGLDAMEQAFGEVRVTQADISKFSDYFLANKRPTNLQAAYGLLISLNLLSDNAFNQSPLLVTLESNTFSAKSKGDDALVKVHVTDLFGEYATDAKVYVNQISELDNDENVLVRNQETVPLSSDKNTVYAFNFLASKPKSGFYSVDLSVNAQGSYFAADNDLVIKVMSSVSVPNVHMSVIDTLSADDDVYTEFSVDYPNKEEGTLKVHALQSISISFGVKVGTRSIDWAKQVFVKFINQKTGTEAVFVAVPEGRKYSVAVDLQESVEKFQGLSGTYTVEIIVGDSLFTNFVSWEFLDVAIHFGKKSRTFEDTSAPLEEIHHQFRQPEPRPSEELSLAFTGLVLSPFLILLIGWLALGGLFSQFPSDVFGLVSSLGFLGSIGSILYLFVKFWLELTMVETLQCLFPLSFVCAFFGLFALRFRSRRRVRAETKQKLA